MIRKLTIVSSIALMLLGSASFASAAGSIDQPRYVLRNIQQGPSRYGVVLVPVQHDQRDHQPYALTGSHPTQHERGYPARAKTIPSYARGTHGW
jgi:hypothetical protein